MKAMRMGGRLGEAQQEAISSARAQAHARKSG